MKGIRNGIERVRSQGRGVFKIGPRTTVAISAVLGFVITRTVDAVGVVGDGVAYKKLLQAIEQGNLQEADLWAERLYDELVDGGVPHAGTNWLNLWEYIIKPKLIREMQEKKEREKKPEEQKNGCQNR